MTAIAWLAPRTSARRGGLAVVKKDDQLDIRCDTCDTTWVVRPLPSGRLPYGWWLCPAPGCLGTGSKVSADRASHE